MGNADDEITVLPPTYEQKAQYIHTIHEQDSVVESLSDDRIEPTDEELGSLRRISETIPLRAWYPIDISC
jgi:hypothetical protein